MRQSNVAVPGCILFLWSLALLLVIGLTATIAMAANDPVRYVNPRWGAGMDRFVDGKNLPGHAPLQPGLHSVGDMYPEIALPRPIVIWAPQTHTGYWFYNNLDPTFQGFRCTHQAHPWAGDYGQFNIMPEVGPAQTNPVQWVSAKTDRPPSGLVR
jgi:putative alpha-1,2-mannosidase